jgi:hypothetical protein
LRAAALLLTACSGQAPEALEEEPICDGRLQEGEGVIDGPFDQDGDGYVAMSNPDCAATYDPYILDCDDETYERHPQAPEVACNDIDDDCNEDTPDALDYDGDGSIVCEDCDDDDPARSPAFSEACWDQLDNDCDGEIDPGCGFDYNGVFALEVPFAYQCALNLVHIDMQSVTVLFNPPYVTIATNESTQPPALDGQIEEDGSFVVEGSIVLPTAGTCDEYYRITGTFLGADRFEGLFESVYDGGGCLNCQNQSVEISAIRL